MSFSSHYLKIRPNPKISWLLIEKKTSSKVPSVCEPNLNSVKLVQPQTIQTWLKVKFLFVSLLLFPSLLPGDSETFAIREWEEKETSYLLALFQSGFAISGPMFEDDSLRAFLWVLQTPPAGPPLIPTEFLLQSAAPSPLCLCPGDTPHILLVLQALHPDRLPSGSEFTSGCWDFCTFDLSLEGR